MGRWPWTRIQSTFAPECTSLSSCSSSTPETRGTIPREPNHLEKEETNSLKIIVLEQYAGPLHASRPLKIKELKLNCFAYDLSFPLKTTQVVVNWARKGWYPTSNGTKCGGRSDTFRRQQRPLFVRLCGHVYLQINPSLRDIDLLIEKAIRSKKSPHSSSCATRYF